MPAPERTPPDVVTVNTDDLRTVLNQRVMHAHQVHGIWDDDNGEKSGTACRECAARDMLIAALDLARPMTTPPDDKRATCEHVDLQPRCKRDREGRCLMCCAHYHFRED